MEKVSIIVVICLGILIINVGIPILFKYMRKKDDKSTK